MKMRDIRSLKDDEVAVVLDNGKEHVALSVHNELGGVCDCCKNHSLMDADVMFIRNAVTGEIVEKFYEN